MKIVDQYPELQAYFPSLELERNRLSKNFILCVAYSIIGQDFSDWIKRNIEFRNQQMAQEKNLLIEVDADIAQAFHQSTSVSSKFIPLESIVVIGDSVMTTQS